MTTKLWFSTHRRKSHRRHLNQVPVGYFWGLICRIPCVGHGIFSSIIEWGFLLSCIKRVVRREDCLREGPSRLRSRLRRGLSAPFQCLDRVRVHWSFLDHHDEVGFEDRKSTRLNSS